MPCAGCLCSSRGVPGWWPVPTVVCNNCVIACWGKGWDNYTLALQAHPLLIQQVGSGIISSWPTDKVSFSLSLWHLNYLYRFSCESCMLYCPAICLGQSRGDHRTSDVQGADYGRNCMHPSATFCCVGVALQRRQQQEPRWEQKAGRFVETLLLFPLQLCADVQLPAGRGLSPHITWHDSVYYIFFIIGTGIQTQMIST